MSDQGYSNSFQSLGYQLNSIRQDWSAINEHGVCLSLWTGEIDWSGPASSMDTRLNADPIEQWGGKPGNTKRIKHLKVAIEKYGGYVDVVLRQGEPSAQGVPSNPWDIATRKHRWRVYFFDSATGHFAAKLEEV